MNKRLIISLILIGVLAFGAGLGSYAWFTSEAISRPNEFKAGTLQLAINGDGDGSYGLDFGIINKMAPGDGTGIVEVKIENDGSLNLGMFRKFEIAAVGDDVAGAEALAKQLRVTSYTVTDWSTGTPGFDFVNLWNTNTAKLNEWDIDDNGFISLYDLTHKDLDDTGKWALLGLKPGYDQTITLAFELDELAGNAVQGKAVKFGMEVIGTQINGDAIQHLIDNNTLTGFLPKYNNGDYFEGRFTGHINDSRQP